jgi:membrane protein YdbS with pleckstrin-like domain
MSATDAWRERYDARLQALMWRKLPPEDFGDHEALNEKRILDPTGLTRFEESFHVSRQHWIVLVRPVLGLLSGLVLLTRPPGVLGALVAVMLGAVLYKRVPLRQGRRERLVAVVIGLVLVVAAPQLGLLGLVVVAALVAWPVYDVLDWWHEIFVVTNKRVMLMHGILTVNRPSVKISSISFSNCVSGPIGDFFHYGTIDLDTSSQRDAALSNIEYVPHAYQVWRLILQLHSEHRHELGDFPPEQHNRRSGGGPAGPAPAPDG